MDNTPPIIWSYRWFSFSDVSSVVIVVGVAVLMVVVVSVTYQLYLKHVQEVPEARTQLNDEKDLDLSALTITVNPLEVRRGFEKRFRSRIISFTLARVKSCEAEDEFEWQ